MLEALGLIIVVVALASAIYNIKEATKKSRSINQMWNWMNDLIESDHGFRYMMRKGWGSGQFSVERGYYRYRLLEYESQMKGLALRSRERMALGLLKHEPTAWSEAKYIRARWKLASPAGQGKLEIAHLVAQAGMGWTTALLAVEYQKETQRRSLSEVAHLHWCLEDARSNHRRVPMIEALVRSHFRRHLSRPV